MGRTSEENHRLSDVTLSGVVHVGARSARTIYFTLSCSTGQTWWGGQKRLETMVALRASTRTARRARRSGDIACGAMLWTLASMRLLSAMSFSMICAAQCSSGAQSSRSSVRLSNSRRLPAEFLNLKGLRQRYSC